MHNYAARAAVKPAIQTSLVFAQL